MDNNKNLSSDVFGKVQLIDPNTINVNNSLDFGTPNYEDMHIYVDLVATRRGRTVVETTSSGTFKYLTTEQADVNFMGYESNKSNTFTTTWFEDDRDGGKSRSSFGIESIKISIDSSYIPKVNIKFVDIRGMEFFNKTNSPYRMLFDFPPPIFQLSIKGYYGKIVKYDLHLVSYTTEFTDKTGNYHIDANFVSLTYAPLSDIPFKYIKHFGILNEMNFDGVDPDVITPPRNTFELITKIERIYSNLNEKLNKDKTYQSYFDSKENYNKSVEAISILKNAKENSTLLNGGNPTFMTLTTNQDGILSEVILNSISEFDIKSAEKRFYEKQYDLYITYINEPITEEREKKLMNIDNVDIVTSTIKSSEYSSMLTYSRDLIDRLNNLKIGTQRFTFGDDISIKLYQITDPQKGVMSIDRIVDNYVIDISKLYIRLNQLKESYANATDNISEDLKKEINNMVTSNLGMEPTIYNIFSVILNDVDNFFKLLRETSLRGEEHNTANVNRLTDYVNEITTTNKMYAFPLVIRDGKRSSPNDLVHVLGDMPELELVHKFVKTFKDLASFENASNIQYNTNENGIHVWIPLSAQDSMLNQIPTNPYFTLNNNNDVILTELVRRFYALSNVIAYNNFFNSADTIKMYSESEAINIKNSLSTGNTNNIENLKTAYISKYLNNINSFYDDIQTKYPDLYKLELNTKTINLKGFNNNSITIDKSNENFVGVIIDDALPEARDENASSSDDTSELINEYLDKINDNNSGNWFSRIFKGFGGDKSKLKYTKTNILFYNDELKRNNDVDVSFSKFFINLTNSERVRTTLKSNLITNLGKIENGGNLILNDLVKKAVTDKQNVYELWYNSLNKTYNSKTASKQFEIDNIIGNNTLSAILFTSAFGNVASPYNIYPNKINDYMKYPLGIVVPQSIILYLGGLAKLIDSGEKNVLINFVNDYKEYLNGYGAFLLADLYDVESYMSVSDKNTFIYEFDKFMGNGMGDMLIIYNKLKNTDENIMRVLKESDLFNELMLKRKTLYVTNTLSFAYENNSDLSIIDISQLRESQNIANTNNFFKSVFTKLNELLKNDNRDQNSENRNSSDMLYDNEIIDETYYSLKNINDKWLSGTNKNNIFPFINDSSRLIDSFLFVDRTMKTINDTIINPEILIDIDNDDSVSVFTALSQILSLNNFEFFPLQNFMTFKAGNDNEWENCFKIDTVGEITTTPAFVCMYIGGGSAYPTNITDNGLFKDDGITSFSDISGLDFNKVADSDDKSFLNNVKSFKVKFADQKQSMFNGFKIDSKEYAETNESLQMLSRIAGDGKQEAPIPVNQSLYNIYRDRSYKATISGLGNATLQPTQYFQLEGVTLFNGVYMILNVEHNIQRNYFTTNFSGLKVLRYPIPRITNVAASIGSDLDTRLGDSDNVSQNRTSGDAAKTSDEFKINSMYTFKLNERNKITEQGRNYLLSIASSSSDSMLRGKNTYPLPFSGSYGHQANNVWVSDVINYYPNNNLWMRQAINLIETYSKQFDLDPNIIAAQILQESAFKVWNYPPPKTNSSASGLTQFIFKTMHSVVVRDIYGVFSTAEKNKITSNGKYVDLSYYSGWSNNSPAREARVEIFQNVIDNPQIMIKAQCALMRHIGNKANNLASTTLMGYFGGESFTKPNFRDSIMKNGSTEPFNYAKHIMEKLETRFGYKNLVSSQFNDFEANASNTENNG